MLESLGTCSYLGLETAKLGTERCEFIWAWEIHEALADGVFLLDILIVRSPFEVVGYLPIASI